MNFPRTARVTSTKAWLATDAATLRNLCFAEIDAGDFTADEVAAKLGKSVLTIRPRISELSARGLIFDSGLRRKNESGHSAIVWTINAQKEMHL